MSAHIPLLVGESLMMTAVLLVGVLMLRRPAAKLLGPRLAYALWLIPALRLVLPPLPGEETVVTLPLAEMAAPPVMVDVVPTAAAAATIDWAAVAPPALFILWLAGAFAVLVGALVRHMRWRNDLLRHGTSLDPIGSVQILMSASVNGPVATGLWRPTIIVPTDFFARYNRAERELAIAHELAHHRAGDLWANAAALVVLAAQWFNPLAWRAVHAFRFDQEAACDARVLAALEPQHSVHQAHSYACAIAKSVAGPRLLLAAPMTSGSKVKERLHMLSQHPQLGLHPAVGRILLGGAAVGALALTASSLPARVVYAAEPDAPPAAEAPPPPGTPAVKEKRVQRVMIVHGDESEVIDLGNGPAADSDGKKQIVHRVVVSHDGEDDADGKDMPRVLLFDSNGAPSGDGAEVRTMRFSMPMLGVDSDALRATLKEQGIDDAKAEAIVKQLEEKRGKAIRHNFSWNAPGAAGAFAMAPVKCKEGERPRVMIDRDGESAGAKTKVRMIQCGAEISRDKQVEAMKKARARLAEQLGTGMGAEIRASVIADLDKGIAELEAKKD